MRKKFSLVLLGLSVVLLGQARYVSSTAKNELDHKESFAINLKARSIVLGPAITLGDIGSISLADEADKRRISRVKIGTAPPPGESTEISMNYIKRILKKEGLREFVPFIKGPRRIRVITAQNEIDKVFLREELAVSDGLCNGVPTDQKA